MDKQSMAYTYNRVWFILKKEPHSDTGYNMDEPFEHTNVKWNKPDIKG